MTVVKLWPSGMLLITDYVNGEWFKRRYIGYTVKDAKKRFREARKEFKDNFLENKTR